MAGGLGISSRALREKRRSLQKRSNIEIGISAIKQLLKGGSPVLPKSKKKRR